MNGRHASDLDAPAPRRVAHRTGVFALLAGLVLTLIAGFAHAAAPHDARPVPRTVLALYDGSEEGNPDETRIHQLAEMPLNHLGYKLRYWNVRESPPDVPADDLAAVLTWFDGPVPDSIRVFERILALCDGGARLVMLGDSGEEDNWASAEMANELFARLGLRATGDTVEVTFESRIATEDKAIIGTERPVVPPYPPFRHLVPQSADLRIHLSMSHGTEISVLVATGSGGGYAASGYVIFYDPASDRMRWLLDPIAFLRLALGSPDHPVPDTTTLSGRRIYFSHIDGDGWNSLTEVDAYRRAQATAAEVVLGELVAPYPDLPVSIGLIAADVLPRLGGVPEAAETARALYALPHVEIASHTYTHPFNWRFFENYDRSRELELVDQQQIAAESLTQRLARAVKRAANDLPADEDNPKKYVAYSDAFPRAFMREPFNLDQEIGDALRMSTGHGPSGKAAELYLWSGETNPFEAAIAAARAAGVRNMNGGDSRYDWEWPSLAYVAPLSRSVGNERQIYAASSNENTYTNDWTGPFYGYATLGQTLESTEAPRRLKPINVYYHMYSGEKPASLHALKQLLDDIRGKDIAPVRASHYAAIADDFFETRIAAGPDGSWYVWNRGAVQTVRFDGAAGRIVDMTRSQGVIGFNSANGDLYVALDEGVETARIVLADQGQPPDALPRLTSSRWRMRDFERKPCGFEAQVQGFGPGEFVFDGLVPGTYRIELADNEEEQKVILPVEANGTARFTLPGPATDWTGLRATCVFQETRL